MVTEQFSLCWDNFHKNMSQGMQSLLENEDLVDVTLAVEGRYLKAHKMVLSVCSPYFRELFQNNPCKHPIVFMKDVSYIALSDLLQFMYQGEVQVAQENLTTFIKTAESLQIKGLTGDNTQSETDNDIEAEKPPDTAPKKYREAPEPAKPPTVTTSTPRPRKILAGPASKRMKLQTPAPVESTPVTAKPETIAGGPTAQEIIQFKMEPYEHSNIESVDNQEETYGNDTLEEATHGDETEDYSLMETGDEEPHPGTSGDGTGDGQDVGQKVLVSGDIPPGKKRTSRTRFVFGGFVYLNKLVAGKPPVRYLGCAEMKRSGCRARAILPLNASMDQMRVTKPHNHPPDENAQDRQEFLNHLRKAVLSMPGSLKAVYQNIALIYPNVAKEMPFKSLCSSMHRWRRNPS